MSRIGSLVLAALAVCVALPAPAWGARVKDIGNFYGQRDNQLMGSGLVVGLNRTGDSPRNEMSIRTLANRLQGLGVSLQMEDILTRNVAVVMVTAEIGADYRPGSRLDVTVASTGDATSLEGGQLLLTPLHGADGEIYAVASGSLLVGGYSVTAGGDTARKNHTTVGRIGGGALVERSIPTGIDYNAQPAVEWVLADPDYTTATRVAASINEALETELAHARDSGTVVMKVPEVFRGHFPDFAALVEAVEVTVDVPARVVVNERTGTVVMGADVKISAVAVAHGSLTIEVQRRQEVSQPNALADGETVVTSESRIQANEAAGELKVIEGVTIGELVSALNAMGVTPRDLITILQSFRAAGALHAELVTM